MEPNPYEAPKESRLTLSAWTWRGFWARVCRIGVALVVVCCGLFLLAGGGQFSLPGMTFLLLVFTSEIGAILGLLLVIIGGVGLALSGLLAK